MSMRWTNVIAATVLMAALGCAGGCSGSDAADPVVADASRPASACAGDPRAQTYAAGMEQPGLAGNVRVRLVTASPAPPAKGLNAWTLQVVDAGGAPVVGAVVTVKPFMPDHGHGSSLVPSATPTDAAGRSSVTGLELFMAGVWEVSILVALPADAGVSATDTAKLTFCVDG